MKIKLIATVITILFSISSISCYALENDEDIKAESNTFSFYSDLFEYDVITTNTNPPKTNVYVYLPSDIMAIEFFRNIEVVDGQLSLPQMDATQFHISSYGRIGVFNEDMNSIGDIIPIIVGDENLDGNVGKMDVILSIKKALIEPNSMDIDMRSYNFDYGFDFDFQRNLNCFDFILLKRDMICS